MTETPIGQAVVCTSDATTLPNWTSPAIALFALLVSGLSLYFSVRKFWADQSTPWVQILLRYVELELQGLAQDAEHFRQMFSVPFESIARKNEVRLRLNGLRDESLRRLGDLAALVDHGPKLRDERAALNAITDSYLENGELSVPADVAKRLSAEYERQSRRYVAALQRFGQLVCERKGVFPKDD